MVSLKGRKRIWYVSGMKGKHHSEKTKKKLSKIMRNRDNAVIFTSEIRKKISDKLKGNKNPNWRGGISENIHRWVEEKKGKAKKYKCESCKVKQAFDWANKDHKYKKRLEDYQALCRSCHQEWDAKHFNCRKKIITSELSSN